MKPLTAKDFALFIGCSFQFNLGDKLRSGRLVNVNIRKNDERQWDIILHNFMVGEIEVILKDAPDVKPILRIIDQMTNEEHGQYREIIDGDYDDEAKRTMFLAQRGIDALNWVEQGLAIKEKRLIEQSSEIN